MALQFSNFASRQDFFALLLSLSSARWSIVPSQGLRVREEIQHQAALAAQLGSTFVSRVLAAAVRQLDLAPRMAAAIDNWSGNPVTDALAMRLNAGIHAMARRAQLPALHALYSGESGDFDAAIGMALARYDAELLAWLASPPQTNEVGRAAAILSALMVLTKQTGYPCELLEIGSSAGLNLNLAQYRYELGSVRVGPPNSTVLIAPKWQGGEPPATFPSILSAAGADLSPLDACSPAVRERLLAYVWADEPERSRRLSAALDVALRHPPDIARGDAVDWLAGKLSAPQPAEICRVIFHSMVLQYLAADKRAALVSAIRAAGQGATASRPLAWIAFEWTQDRSCVLLRLTTWPAGETRDLAVCHPYGKWIHWLR